MKQRAGFRAPPFAEPRCAVFQ